MMKKLMLSCEQATYLSALQEERKLSISEQMRLRIHLWMCVFCRRFVRQMNEVTSHTHEMVDVGQRALLSAESKERMKKKLYI